MKYLANIFRVLVGLLFIFSGLIKSNDPTGFSYKLDEYFSVFSSDLEAAQDSVTIQVKTLDGVVSNAFIINPNSPSIEIHSINTPWKAIPLGNGLTDSIYFADATISCNNQSLFESSINAEDSGSILLEAEVVCSINQKEIATKQLEFLSFESNEDVLSVDVSSFVKESSWLVNFFQGLRPYALGIAIFVCVFEIILGLALLIGWSPKLIVGLSLLMIVFFTFLTWYSATFNKVTDCGCFGDAIKLSPWESFYKDIILLVSLLIILLGIKYIKPIFSNPFAVKLLTVFTILSVGFSVYCWHYLPVKNYLKFKEGNNIKDLVVIPDGAPSDVYENVFIYAKDGKNEEFTIEELGKRNLKEEGYEFVDRIDKLISKGYEPEIHDFKIMDEDRTNDYVDDFFANENWKILIVINDVEKANLKAIPELKELLKEWKKAGYEVYPLTASSVDAVNEFRHEHQLDIPFYYGDKTNLKSIVRSNPGLVLFEGNVVKKTWPSTRLPSVKRLMKIVK